MIFLFLWYHCFKCCCYWERNTTFSNLFLLILKLWETYLKQNQKKQNSNDQKLIPYGCIYNNKGSFYLMYQMLLMMRIARNTPKHLNFKDLRVDWEDKKIKKLPLARIELATFALQVQRSTTKLKRQLFFRVFVSVF